MQVAVTGSSGFIGSNLRVALSETTDLVPIEVTRTTSEAELEAAVLKADVIVHLAGANRPADPNDYEAINVGLTRRVCDLLSAANRSIPLIVASSARAGERTPYGESKEGAEAIVRRYGAEQGAITAIYRLPNVFGKWSRPNYNSAVATFCYNTVHGMPLTVHDRGAKIRLVYVDDVVADIIAFLRAPETPEQFRDVKPVYETDVGTLADTIQGFGSGSDSLKVDDVGAGLVRALYATYVSYLPPERFSYPLTKHEDERGYFAEILKTNRCGQISVFSAHPGVTRGGHYHHSKTEKFVVVGGEARFKFRHILTGAVHEIVASDRSPIVVETVPGWAHDVTNIGKGMLYCLVWANENFDPARPDTIRHEV